jgi:hypothetical protein
MQFDKQEEFIKTKAMIDGSICHNYILENESFSDNYFVLPENIKKDRRKKVYKEIEKELLEYYDKDHIIDFDYQQRLDRLRFNIEKYEIVPGLKMRDILDNSQKEISIFWTVEIDGKEVQKKAKLDILFPWNKYIFIFDLKKAEDIYWFHHSFLKYKLYRQGDWYSEGIEHLISDGREVIFINLPFEFKDEYRVIHYELNGYYRDLGRRENKESLLKYLKYKE